MGNLNKRYVDLLNYRPQKEETRTPEEIINDVRRALNGSI